MTQVKFKHSLIYFIQGEKTKLIKIGKANVSIESRLNRIQALSPDKLNFIGGTFEPEYLEVRLHRKFESYRMHGEWFQPNKDLIEFINSSCFKSIDSLYWAYFEVYSKSKDYDQLVSLSESEISLKIKHQAEQSLRDFWESDYFKVIRGYKA